MQATGGGSIEWTIPLSQVDPEVIKLITGGSSLEDIERRKKVNIFACPWRDDTICDTECGEFGGCIASRAPIGELLPGGV